MGKNGNYVNLNLQHNTERKNWTGLNSWSNRTPEVYTVSDKTETTEVKPRSKLKLKTTMAHIKKAETKVAWTA